MLEIEIMQEADIGFAKAMTDCERWGYLEGDFKRLIAYEPDGCFVAWENGERVGIITSTTYEEYAFVGSLIVRKENRGTGFGTKLLSHAIDYLKSKGVRTIELDGVFPAVTLYRKLGFKDKYLSMRMIKRAGEGIEGVKGKKGGIKKEELEVLVDFDRSKTGLDRERVIRRLNRDFGDGVYLIKNRKKVSGYAIIRQREGGYFLIGPWLAENREGAEELFSTIAGRYARSTLTVGVPEINRGAREIITSYGFIYSQPSLRMFWGAKRNYEKNIYAILSPEKG